MRNGGIVGAHAFGGLCFDSHTRRVDAEQTGDVLLNRLGMRADLRSSEDQSAIHISHHVSRVLDLLAGFADKDRRVCALPFGISRGEVGSDVSRGNCAQQGIGQGVQQYVAVGVSGETAVVWNQHAADL